MTLRAQNRSIKLDGTGDYIHVENDASLNSSTQVSVAAWVKVATNDVTMVIARKGGSNTPAYSLNRQSNKFMFFIHNGSWRNSGFGGSVVTEPGGLYHVVGVYTGSALQVYVNGILDSSTPISGAISTTTDIFSIGSDTDPFAAYFNGYIDEVSVWDKALNESQIQTILNDTLGAEYYSSADSGLVAYWRFDELEDLGVNADGEDDVRDFSIYQNHGDLVGDASLDTTDIITKITHKNSKVPDSHLLLQNYPNPFNPSTRISYEITHPGFVSLIVYDILGREIQTLVDSYQLADTYTFDFDASKLSSGTYFYKLQVGSYVDIKKMLYLR